MIKLTLSFSLNLIYFGFYKVGTWWNFKNHVGHFYRLYWITEGECKITINHNKQYYLKKDDLFLVPKYAVVDYECDNYMEHYYICFTDDSPNFTSDIDPLRLDYKKSMSPLDKLLFARLIKLFPNESLPSVNPKSYDNKNKTWYNKEVNRPFPNSVEGEGILKQLFSRFFTDESLNNINHQSYLHTRISIAIQYINQNIANKIIVRDLADLINMCPDHFTKSFHRIMGINPSKYIQMRRIEIAMHLLSTTNLSIKEIALNVGLETASQFTRMFVKVKGISPSFYRSTSGNYY